MLDVSSPFYLAVGGSKLHSFLNIPTKRFSDGQHGSNTALHIIIVIRIGTGLNWLGINWISRFDPAIPKQLQKNLKNQKNLRAACSLYKAGGF
jgi:hypothetical protein